MESAGRWISIIRDAAIVMAENTAYIRKELPTLDLPDEVRAAVVGMCDGFGAALSEVAEEVVALHGELYRHAGGESPDSTARDPDPNARMSHIVSRLRAENESLHSVVTQLESIRESDPSAGTVYVLVTESGANILNAFIRIREVQDAIAAELEDRH